MKPRLKLCGVIAIVILLLFYSNMCTYNGTMMNVEPETIYVPFEVEKTIITKQYIKVPEYIDRYHIEYREWESKGELQTWLNLNDISEQEYIRKEHDCDDFAIELSHAAREDGYWIGITLEQIDKETGHMLNFAFVGNRMYLIEPQTDIITPYGWLDK